MDQTSSQMQSHQQEGPTRAVMSVRHSVQGVSVSQACVHRRALHCHSKIRYWQ